MLKNISRVSTANEWNIFLHEKINFVSPRGHVIFLLLYKMWRFSEDFRPLSEDLRRFSKIAPKARQMFPNISEDCRRQPKEIQRCFDHTPINLSVVKRDKRSFFQKWYLHMWGSHIFTCEDIISSLSICYHSVYHWLLYNKLYSFLLFFWLNRAVNGWYSGHFRF